MIQIYARFLNENAADVAAQDCGEIVAFNCVSYDQAVRFKSTFEQYGNKMIEDVGRTIGATKIKYFIKG